MKKDLKDALDRLKKMMEENENIVVKVALFGQPGAGKSSLINKIIGENVMEVGPETDKSREKKPVEWKGLILTDLPGYDTERFPASTFFDKFDIPSYDLFLCVFEGKFHHSDSKFFSRLKSSGRTCVFVRNKQDNIFDVSGRKTEKEIANDIVEDISKHVGQDVNVIFTSCKSNFGLDQLGDSILDNLSESKRERWARNAKAYSHKFLNEKKRVCEKIIIYHAGLAAVNGLNPIPGLDVSVDIGTVLNMFRKIRDTYGLDPDSLEGYLTNAKFQAFNATIKMILKFASKDGVVELLTKYFSREAIKEVSKYVPFVGQVIAMMIGFTMVKGAGDEYHRDCFSLAEKILKENILKN